MTKKYLVKWMIALLFAIMAPLATPGAAAPAAMAQSSFSGVVEICEVRVQAGLTLRVRSGPGLKYNVSAPGLRNQQKIVVFESIGDWVRHGDFGWSFRPNLRCQTLTREQITQQTLPTGYWLHSTAVDFQDNRLPAYDVISGPDGIASQVFLPREGQRVGHVVSFTQPKGDYTFKGVACELSQDKHKNGSLNVEASHTNSGSYQVSAEEGWLRVVCDASPVNGFSSVPAGIGAPVNSPYSDRASFVPAEEKGQFLMLAKECGTGKRLPSFDSVKEPNGDVWSAFLPDEQTRTSVCFENSIVLIEGRYEANMVACELLVDRERDGMATERIGGFANNIPFSINTIPDNGESWGMVKCMASPHNGFSIRWIGPLDGQSAAK